MAILQNAHTVTATVSYISNGKPSKFEGKGDYYSVCFESSELKEKTVWKNLTLDEVGLLHKGMTVTLSATARNGRNTWDVILPENTYGKPAPTQNTSTAPAKQPIEGLSPELKREMAAYSREMINLYSFLWKQSKEALEAQGCDDVETIRTSTSSVFIAVQRKFNLA